MTSLVEVVEVVGMADQFQHASEQTIVKTYKNNNVIDSESSSDGPDVQEEETQRKGLRKGLTKA